ncbi:MAG: hypothetical protein C4344_02615, partial [Acidimicrobiia bacterium]
MPEPLLTVLKFCLLALIYLFFFRVLRAVWAEMGGARPATSAPPSHRPHRARPKPVGRLKIVEPSDQRGRTFELAEEVTVGRAPGCQVALSEDSYVSQLHARVFARDGRYYV